MTEKQILEKLKKSWEKCKANEKDKQHEYADHIYSYNYGIIMETVRYILQKKEVWNEEEKAKK